MSTMETKTKAVTEQEAGKQAHAEPGGGELNAKKLTEGLRAGERVAAQRYQQQMVPGGHPKAVGQTLETDEKAAGE